MRQPLPDVSVVVPTDGGVVILDRCLHGLAAQEGVSFEVIVVGGDDRRVGALTDCWRERLPLRFLQSRDPDASVKRNVGWSVARAPIVAFTDDDCEPAPGWLTSIAGGFSDPAVDLVQGPVAIHPEGAPAEGLFTDGLEARSAMPMYPSANLAYRRSTLERLHGYDNLLTVGADTDLAYRLLESGGRSLFVPEALIWQAIRPVSFLTHLRSLPRFAGLPGVIRRHPQVRTAVHRRWFWKNTHPVAWLSLLGLATGWRYPAAFILALPHLRRRRHPGLVVSDWAECLVMAAGSVRHRSVLL